MSLQYRSVQTYLVPWIDIDQTSKDTIIQQLRFIDYLDADQRQMQHRDIYEVLFSKIRNVTISIYRSERNGIWINVTYLSVPNVEMSLQFERKKSKRIALNISFDDDPNIDYIEPSVVLQKLLLSRLPKNIRDVLMYYIYPPTTHDPIEIEQYVGPAVFDGQNSDMKTKTNYPPNWHLNNKWDIVSNFAFSLMEVANKSIYNNDLEYPITLKLDVCKEMCRENEEAIKVNKLFKRSF